MTKTYTFDLAAMTKASEDLRPIITTDSKFAADARRSMVPTQTDGKLSGMVMHVDASSDPRLSAIAEKHGVLLQGIL